MVVEGGRMALAQTTLLEQLVARLTTLEPSDHPVLSLFLDNRPEEHGRDRHQAFVRKELRARAFSFGPRTPERAGFERDAERIRVWLRDELRSSANAAALFACDAE